MHYICQKVSNRILPPSQHPPIPQHGSPGVLRRKWPKTHQKIAWYWEPWYFRSKWLNTHKLPSNIKKSILSIVNTYLDRLRKYLWYPTNFLWVCFCSLGVIKYLLGVIRMPKVYFPILAAFLEVVVMQLYNMSTNHTVWKFENFSFTQILCEINFAV